MLPVNSRKQKFNGRVIRPSLLLSLTLLLLSGWLGGWQSVRAADYLNEQEAERVRDAQEIDKRTEVFLHIADGRLNALRGSPSRVPDAPKDKKEEKNQTKEKEKQPKQDY